MSEDERPPRAADLNDEETPAAPSDRAGWLELLAEGEAEIEGRMPWSSNATFLVRLTSARASGRAIYKPEAGERPLWDYPSGLCQREVAAYELSVATGLDVVPETVLRETLEYGRGSIQRFIDADFNEHYFTMLERPELVDALRRVGGFDLLANSGDRKGGHLLLEPPRRVWAIDNGLCCHEDDKLRTVIWEFAGSPLPDEVLAACRRVVDSLPEALVVLLDEEECLALQLRAEHYLMNPYFPLPWRDHRSYPWPLV